MEMVRDGNSVSPMDLLSKFSFKHLAVKRQEVVDEIKAKCGYVDTPTEEILDAVQSLMSGKADRVGILLKEVIPAHIDACKAQIDSLKKTYDRIESLAYQAVLLNKSEPIEGLTYRFAVQPGPKCVDIESARAVPSMFKKTRFSITLDIPDDQDEIIKWWIKFLDTKGKELKLTYQTETLFDKDLMKQALDKVDGYVPGATLGQNLNLKISAGHVKPTKTAGSKKLRLVE
ncbi:MAG: hypothetical protein ACXVCY_04515 [Pseudobdellovibrionaceae bacterium]